MQFGRALVFGLLNDELGKVSAYREAGTNVYRFDSDTVAAILRVFSDEIEKNAAIRQSA